MTPGSSIAILEMQFSNGVFTTFWLMVQRNQRKETPQSMDRACQVKMAIYKVKFTTSYHVMSMLFIILYVIFTGITCTWWQRLGSRVDSSTE